MKPTNTVSMNQNSSLDALTNDHHHVSVRSSQCGVAPEKHVTQNAETKLETGKAEKRKYKRKREMNLPRRASNRLAGIKADPVQDLETIYGTRRVAKKRKGKFYFLPCEFRRTFEEYSFAQPLDELLSEPCIKFAVETLTGVKLEKYYSHTPSQVLHNSDAGEEGCKKVLLLPENQYAATAEIGEIGKGKENSGVSSEMPLYASFMDPRVEYSIQTQHYPFRHYL
ncbi:unnamed protein product [Sphenostylis stenocarpa]|uniref:Uncharacterized protein n=1 Tax=Sphenostylis stenocarpa TaxID=92480 RepID=A0AA86W291_9FABA|nr:unnamed protein product [Sphenostylis stenocarpa]